MSPTAVEQNTNAGYGFTPANVKASKGTDEVNQYSQSLTHPLPLSTTLELIKTANALVSPRGKGIYATDETPDGCDARLAAAAKGAIKDDTSDAERGERRKQWRMDSFAAANNKYISGLIMHHESLHTFNLAPLMAKSGILVGIRADTDSYPLPSSPLEPATQGLDDLLPRMQAAYAAGARFSKWRAPFLINAAGTLPSPQAIATQSESLARFASISQQAGLVPIVEPDIDFTDSDASLGRSVEVHVKVISAIWAACTAHGVLPEGALIKPSFPQTGMKHPDETASYTQIGEATALVLVRSLPIGVPGVVFLSGGLSDEDAVLFLNAVNKFKNNMSETRANDPTARLPMLSFSFGRGLQGEAMAKWVKGDVDGARETFSKRAEECYKAARGEL